MLKNSIWRMGHLFGDSVEVNALLGDPGRDCVMLYPGVQAANLTHMSPEARALLTASARRLTIFVIDGTWSTARTTVNQSPNLKAMRRICFTPAGVSNFRIRQQPRPECYSTIEAIHHTIELLGCASDDGSRPHDRLLRVFDKMVDRQIELAHSVSARDNHNSP